MQLLLTLIDHCNISLSTIPPILQDSGMTVFEHFSQYRISYTKSLVIHYRISGNLKIPDTLYPIFLKIVRYEPDTDTDTDIIAALFSNLLLN